MKIFTGSNKGESNGTVRSELKLFPCLIQTNFCNDGVCSVSYVLVSFFELATYCLKKENYKDLAFLYIILVFYCQRCG